MTHKTDMEGHKGVFAKLPCDSAKTFNEDFSGTSQHKASFKTVG